MTDKMAVVNLTKIIAMVEDAKSWLLSDTEQTSFILAELIQILESADSLEQQLGQ